MESFLVRTHRCLKFLEFVCLFRLLARVWAFAVGAETLMGEDAWQKAFQGHPVTSSSSS